jgi:hypothetical protein
VRGILKVPIFVLLEYTDGCQLACELKTSEKGAAVTLTSMNLCTHFAMFFASLAMVMGPGGLRKSLVGI